MKFVVLYDFCGTGLVRGIGSLLVRQGVELAGFPLQGLEVLVPEDASGLHHLEQNIRSRSSEALLKGTSSVDEDVGECCTTTPHIHTYRSGFEPSNLQLPLQLNQ